MEVLSKDLRELSGQVEDNARERLGLPDIGAYQRIGGPLHHELYTRILGRAVSFQVSPDFTQTQVVQIIEGVGKVLRTLA